MKITFLIYCLSVLILSSCHTNNRLYNKKEYKRSKILATYTGMANELQDGVLVLKENGYFRFYEKFWFTVSIKQDASVGRYTQKNDTLYLDWLGADSLKKRYYLSKKCFIDSSTRNLWFIDDSKNPYCVVKYLTEALKDNCVISLADGSVPCDVRTRMPMRSPAFTLMEPVFKLVAD
jgi:hypothetical protein